MQSATHNPLGSFLKGEVTDGKIVSENAEGNLIKRKELVVEKIAEKSQDANHEM